MTAITALPVRHQSSLRPVLVGLGLAVVVLARWAATGSSLADPIIVGLTFGSTLLLIALAAGRHIELPRPSSIPVGLAGGAVLIGVALMAGASSVRPAAAAFPLAPWAVATVLVATAEEAVLRGRLFDAIAEPRGLLAAVLLTSAAFALMHVPLYGWHVVPLDFGVGLWLAGVRLFTGGIAAPALAHSIADLATYWL